MARRKAEDIDDKLQAALDMLASFPPTPPAPVQETPPADIPPSGKNCLGLVLAVPAVLGYSAFTLHRICGWMGKVSPFQECGTECIECGRIVIDKRQEDVTNSPDSIVPRLGAHVFVESKGLWFFVELMPETISTE